MYTGDCSAPVATMIRAKEQAQLHGNEGIRRWTVDGVTRRPVVRTRCFIRYGISLLVHSELNATLDTKSLVSASNSNRFLSGGPFCI